MGHFQDRVSNEPDTILNDPIFRQIPMLLTQPDADGVSLLKAKGKYGIGAEAKELLTLVNATHKRLYDKAELLKQNSANKADKEKEKSLQLSFSVVYAGIVERLSKAKTINDIIGIESHFSEIRNEPIETNITIYNTLGGDSIVDLMKLISTRRKEIKTEVTKPKELRKLTPDEQQRITNTLVTFRNVSENIGTIQNFSIEDNSGIEKVNGLVKRIKHAYEMVINDPTNGLNNDWKGFEEFNKKYTTAITDINKEKGNLQTLIDKANKKKDVKSRTDNNYRRQQKSEARNAIQKASIVSSFHENLEQYLKLPTEERLDFNLDLLETVLDKQVTTFTIKNDVLLLIEKTVPIFSPAEINQHLNKIADVREAHQREVDAKTKVATIETDPDLYEDINQSIDSLRNIPAITLYDQRGKADGKITQIKSKISTIISDRKRLEKVLDGNYKFVKKKARDSKRGIN